MASRTAILLLVIVQAMYGLLPATGKVAFEAFSPLGMTSIRILGAALIIMLIHLARRRALWPGRGGWVVMLAMLGIILNMGFFASGLILTHPVNATILVTTIPVFTYAFAVLLGKETIGPRRAAGIALAFVGALLLVGVSGFQAGIRNAAGDAMILLNCISFSLFLVLGKRYMQEHHPLDVTAWMFMVAAAIFIPVAWLVGTPAESTAATPRVWAAMAFIVMGPTVIAYVLNATALRTVPSSTVGAFIYLQMPVSVLAAGVILDTLPSWTIIPSTALIVAGIWLVARRRPSVAPLPAS